MTRTLLAGTLYFGLVFATGFVLGTIRVLWVVPHAGTQLAELMEAPFMLVATVLAARWVVRRLGVPVTTRARLGMGCFALSLLVIAELTFVLGLRGMSIGDYLADRDPLAATVYCLLLGVFAVMPLLVGRRHPTGRSR